MIGRSRNSFLWRCPWVVKRFPENPFRLSSGRPGSPPWGHFAQVSSISSISSSKHPPSPPLANPSRTSCGIHLLPGMASPRHSNLCLPCLLPFSFPMSGSPTHDPGRVELDCEQI